MATDFKRYWQFLCREAEGKGLTKSGWMDKCGFPKQSYTKYRKGQGITAKTMVNLMEGLNLTLETLERKSGIPLSDQEKSDLTRAQWLKKYAAGIDYLINHNELMEEIQSRAKKGYNTGLGVFLSPVVT